MKNKEIIVDSELEGMRLDRYLRKNFKNEPLSKIFGAIRVGDVKINGKKTKENYRLLLNDKIFIKSLSNSDIEKDFEKSRTEEVKIKKSDLEKYKKMIIFENEDFFIVNKKEKIAMHKGTGHKYGLAEVFKKIFKNKNINFANRLDFETSGLVIGCKNLKFLRYITEKIRNNEINKKYLAIVHNEKCNVEKNKKTNMKSFEIENFLTITENKVVVSEKPVSKESKKSITKFEEINLNKIKNSNEILALLKKSGNDKNISLFDIDLITGRKHQIRAQLAYKKLPIVGDKKYGIKDNSDKFFLCCYFIAFDNYKFSILEKAFTVK